MTRKEQLSIKIEAKRQELYQVANTFGLHAKQSLQISKELDCLLNEYIFLSQNSSPKPLNR